MASFDGNGLVIDRLADIKADMQTNLRSVFGDGINLAETSPFGILIGVMAERYSLLYELLEAVYQASFPNTAFGVYLDELVALNGITRDAATFSTVSLTFTRSNGTNDGDVTVPLGTQVTDPNSPTVIWSTDAAGTILDGTDIVAIPATASEVGPIGALTGVLTSMTSIPTNVASVTNPAGATEGRAEETDSELKVRRETQLGRSGTATEPGIRSALINMTEVTTATVVLNDTDLTVGDLPPHSFEAFAALESGFQLGQITTLTPDVDLVTGNSIQLQLNGTDIAASPVVFATSSDDTLAVIAAAFQTEIEIVAAEAILDPDSITIQAATETAFTATAVTTGGATQTTFAVTTAVADGTIDLIGQVIWDSKAAGIQTEGEFTADVVDSSGDPHTVKFSDIGDTTVYVRYTLTTDANYVQATAESAIKTALVSYSTTDLLPGVDVLNYKVVCVASDVNAAGILGIVVDFSLDGVVFAPANIGIVSSEFATIDAANITFV